MDLENEIQIIKERNSRVELDKKWETSFIRLLAISLITYAVALIWLLMIKEDQSWLKAFVPVAGFVLSTFSLPPLKQWWIKKLK